MEGCLKFHKKEYLYGFQQKVIRSQKKYFDQFVSNIDRIPLNPFQTRRTCSSDQELLNFKYI